MTKPEFLPFIVGELIDKPVITDARLFTHELNADGMGGTTKALMDELGLDKIEVSSRLAKAEEALPKEGFYFGIDSKHLCRQMTLALAARDLIPSIIKRLNISTIVNPENLIANLENRTIPVSNSQLIYSPNNVLYAWTTKLFSDFSKDSPIPAIISGINIIEGLVKEGVDLNSLFSFKSRYYSRSVILQGPSVTPYSHTTWIDEAAKYGLPFTQIEPAGTRKSSGNPVYGQIQLANDQSTKLRDFALASDDTVNQFRLYNPDMHLEYPNNQLFTIFGISPRKIKTPITSMDFD